MTFTSGDFVRLFDAWAGTICENREYLVGLDSIGGDGDLGLAMSDGFTAIVNMLRACETDDIGKLLFGAGKTMSAYAPSSLGTLLAFGFINAGKALKGKTEISGAELGLFLEAIESAIAERGKAKPGDKTFIDGFAPAVTIMNWPHAENEIPAALRQAAQAARVGADATVGMVAKFGRIAVRGDESKGILDPGAVVAAMLVETMADTFAGE